MAHKQAPGSRDAATHAFAIAGALLGAALPALAADIVLTPPAAGGLSVTHAAGNTTRFRVGEDGVVTFPGNRRGARPVITGQNNAINVLVDTDGQLGTVSSSIRVKDAVADMGDATDALMKLRPVTFRYKQYGPESRVQYGLIAEEVEHEFQKQQRTIERLTAEIASMRSTYAAEIAALKGAIAALGRER